MAAAARRGGGSSHGPRVPPLAAGPRPPGSAARVAHARRDLGEMIDPRSGPRRTRRGPGGSGAPPRPRARARVVRLWLLHGAPGGPPRARGETRPIRHRRAPGRRPAGRPRIRCSTAQAASNGRTWGRARRRGCQASARIVPSWSSRATGGYPRRRMRRVPWSAPAGPARRPSGRGVTTRSCSRRSRTRPSGSARRVRRAGSWPRNSPEPAPARDGQGAAAVPGSHGLEQVRAAAGHQPVHDGHPTTVRSPHATTAPGTRCPSAHPRPPHAGRFQREPSANRSSFQIGSRASIASMTYRFAARRLPDAPRRSRCHRGLTEGHCPRAVDDGDGAVRPPVGHLVGDVRVASAISG